MRSALGALLVVPAWVLLACASGGGHPDEGTLIVAEVSRVLNRKQVAEGDVAPGEHWKQLAEWVRERGLSDADVDAGRAIVIRRGLYWYNTVSGIKHSMVLLAHLEPGMTVEVGNVVELRVDVNARAVGQRVRAASLVDGGCYFVEMPSSLLEDVAGVIGMVGSRGIATLYCAGLESEGWQRPDQFWVKLPGAHPPAAGASAAPMPERAQPVVAIAPLTDAEAPAPTPLKDHALLLLFRTDVGFGSPFDVPFWVDGEKAADLPGNRCEMALLSPGEHVVTAGTGNAVTGVKRETKLVVQAGDRWVVEYIVNNSPQTQFGLSELFSSEKREETLQRAWAMADRRATPKDRCAIQHAPQMVGRPASAASPTSP